MTISDRLIAHVQRRAPDFIIGGADAPYLRRWWLIPRNRWFNIYVHQFLRSDDDRALHDHPWWNASILLEGKYIEHVRKPDGTVAKEFRRPGAVYVRQASQAHRVELLLDRNYMPKPVWTLFITGPKIREWGFLCPKGWKHWRDYTRETADGNEVGEGCGS